MLPTSNRQIVPDQKDFQFYMIIWIVLKYSKNQIRMGWRNNRIEKYIYICLSWIWDWLFDLSRSKHLSFYSIVTSQHFTLSIVQTKTTHTKTLCSLPNSKNEFFHSKTLNTSINLVRLGYLTIIIRQTYYNKNPDG